MYLMAKFENKNKNNEKYKDHFDRMDKLEKKYEKNPTIKNIMNDPMYVISSLKISSSEAERL